MERMENVYTINSNNYMQNISGIKMSPVVIC